MSPSRISRYTDRVKVLLGLWLLFVASVCKAAEKPNILLTEIRFQVSAIIYYLVRKRQNLIRPMVNGKHHGEVEHQNLLKIESNFRALTILFLMGACLLLIGWSSYF
jgi:hypothetical protein